MAKRRKVTPVTLTAKQRERLERLWFIYGNYGAKRTPGNHSFIQRLLENGYDERPLYNKRTPKSERPTLECEAAVEAVLAMINSLDPNNWLLESARATAALIIQVVHASCIDVRLIQSRF
jgi:hypothetical protein